MQKPDRKNAPKEVETFSLLTANKAREYLKDLDGWQLTDDHKMLYREFILQDFMAAIDLIDHVAVIAEEEKHHPDMHLTQYRNLRIGLTTHDVGGLSQKDFTVALKIKDLPILLHKHNNGVVIDQQSRDSHKIIQPKQKQAVSRAIKKSDNKAKGIKMKEGSNRMNRLTKKT